MDLCTDHGSTFRDPSESLSEVLASTYEGGTEGVLGNVVGGVGGCEDLGLVDKVAADGLEDLSLDNVSDAGLGHDLEEHVSEESRSPGRKTDGRGW
jgi:uncharacterized protein YidB (DUF937 family)